MEYIATFIAWLQQLFAKSVLNSVIILLLTVLFAAITDDWLNEKYFNVKTALEEEGLSSTEYWLFLIVVYGSFFVSIRIVEGLIAVVFLTETKEK